MRHLLVLFLLLACISCRKNKDPKICVTPGKTIPTYLSCGWRNYDTAYNNVIIRKYVNDSSFSTLLAEINDTAQTYHNGYVQLYNVYKAMEISEGFDYELIVPLKEDTFRIWSIHLVENTFEYECPEDGRTRPFAVFNSLSMSGSHNGTPITVKSEPNGIHVSHMLVTFTD